MLSYLYNGPVLRMIRIYPTYGLKFKALTLSNVYMIRSFWSARTCIRMQLLVVHAM